MTLLASKKYSIKQNDAEIQKFRPKGDEISA